MRRSNNGFNKSMAANAERSGRLDDCTKVHLLNQNLKIPDYMSSWVIQKATGISWLSNTHVLVPLKTLQLIA